MRIGIATAAKQPDYHADDRPLAQELPRWGIVPELRIWSDAGVAWERYDAVLIRSVWDYFERYPEFLAWLDRLEAAAVRVLNPVPLLRWNADKRYLLELERCGAAVIPTRLVRRHEIAAVAAASGWNEYVVKPRVSAGAWHTIRGARGSASFDTAIATLPRALDYVLQPLRQEIEREGEWSFVFFAGDFSHAVLKRPRAGDFRVQTNHGGTLDALVPPPFLLDQAVNLLRPLRELGFRDWLYARVDAVPVAGRLELMELELIEPNLFLSHAPGSAQRLAHALAEQLQRQPVPRFG